MRFQAYLIIFVLMATPQENSFLVIYDRFKDKVYNTVLGYLQNVEDAEEVTQDVFVEVHRSIHQFREESSLSTWIYRISVNKSLDHLKSKNRKKRFSFITSLWDKESGDLVHDPPVFDHPGVLMEQKENARILFGYINQLPEKQQTAFILSKVEGLGNKEIAEIMEMNVGAIESLLSRAKENLKKNINK